MANDKILFRRGDRAFLNRKGLGGDASVSWSIDVTTSGGGKHVWTSGSLVVRDCARPVTLDLGMDSAADFNNSVRKLEILEAACARARMALYAANREARAGRARAREVERREKQRERIEAKKKGGKA